MNKIENRYYVYLTAIIIIFLSALFISALKIYNRDVQIANLTKKYNNVRGQNIILKSRINYEQQQKQIYYRMINQKVQCLNIALSRIYPGYDYRKKIDIAINDNTKIESLPESLIEIYIEQKLIIPHGLKNYQKTVPEIIWPVSPDQSYITTKNGEYGTRRPYSYMKYKHEGIDIGSPYDDSVIAIYNGVIHRIYYDEGGGWSLSLKFKIKEKYYFCRYRHLEKIYVKAGDNIFQGKIIARMGNTGYYSLGKHLHFELWEWTGRYYKNINPVLNSTWGNKIITSIN